MRIGSSVHPTAAEPEASRGLINVAFRDPDGRQIMVAHNATDRPQTFDVQVGGRHFTATLAAGAAATYRWHAPDGLAPADDLGWVDLDYGRGPAGTPTGRLTASVGPEVVGALTQVKLPEGWLAYSLPYGAELRTAAPAQALPRTGWRLASTGTEPVEDEPLAHVLDGNRATRWSSGAGQEQGMALSVDLTRPTTFSQILLDAGPSLGDYLRRYSVQVSDDGSAWTEIARGPGKPSLDGTMTIALPPTTARHLRLVSEGTAGSRWSIAELNLLLAPPAAEEPGGAGLVSDSGRLPDGTPVSGHYNQGPDASTVAWPMRGFGYTYRLPARAAVTFAELGGAPADPVEPRESEPSELRPGG
jgi:hypothetical protein